MTDNLGILDCPVVPNCGLANTNIYKLEHKKLLSRNIQTIEHLPNVMVLPVLCKFMNIGLLFVLVGVELFCVVCLYCFSAMG